MKNNQGELLQIVLLDKAEYEPHDATAIETERNKPVMGHQRLQQILEKECSINTKYAKNTISSHLIT